VRGDYERSAAISECPLSKAHRRLTFLVGE